MVILNPADATETRAAVKWAIDHKGPVYLRLGRLGVAPIFDEATYNFEMGKGITLKDGNDVTIIATGLMTGMALEACEMLKAEGISARVINIHTIKPIDADIIVKASKETGAIVTCEEHNIIGGLGSAVAEVLCENAPCPMVRIGTNDEFGASGTPAELLKAYGLTAENICESAKKAIAKK